MEFHWRKVRDYNKVLVYCLNPFPAKVIYLKFKPVEVVSRYRDTQPQVVENYLYLINLKPNIYKSWSLDTHFIPNNSDLVD